MDVEIEGNIVELCDGCKEEIMYESPENFDPVCMSEDGSEHCESCCACGEDETGEPIFKTDNSWSNRG